MFGEKALELIKELNRTPDSVPPFNVSKLLFKLKVHVSFRICQNFLGKSKNELTKTIAETIF